MTSRSNWVAFEGLTKWGSASTRLAAMNLVDKPYRHGVMTVRQINTGETWTRRGGSWSKTASGKRSTRGSRLQQPKSEHAQRRLL